MNLFFDQKIGDKYEVQSNFFIEERHLSSNWEHFCVFEWQPSVPHFKGSFQRVSLQSILNGSIKARSLTHGVVISSLIENSRET